MLSQIPRGPVGAGSNPTGIRRKSHQSSCRDPSQHHPMRALGEKAGPAPTKQPAPGPHLHAGLPDCTTGTSIRRGLSRRCVVLDDITTKPESGVVLFVYMVSGLWSLRKTKF